MLITIFKFHRILMRVRRFWCLLPRLPPVLVLCGRLRRQSWHRGVCPFWSTSLIYSCLCCCVVAFSCVIGCRWFAASLASLEHSASTLAFSRRYCSFVIVRVTRFSKSYICGWSGIRIIMSIECCVISTALMNDRGGRGAPHVMQVLDDFLFVIGHFRYPHFHAACAGW